MFSGIFVVVCPLICKSTAALQGDRQILEWLLIVAGGSLNSLHPEVVEERGYPIVPCYK